MTDGFSNQFKRLTEREVQLPSERITGSSKLAKKSEEESDSKLERQGNDYTLFTSITAETNYYWKYLINQLSVRVCVCVRAPLMLPVAQTTHITHSSLAPPQVLGYKYTHSHTCASSFTSSVLILTICLVISLREFSQFHNHCLWPDETHLQHTLEWPWGSTDASRRTIKYLHARLLSSPLRGKRTLKHNS